MSEENSSKSPQFETVLSTTWKVVLSLIVISLLATVAVAILGGFGALLNSADRRIAANGKPTVVETYAAYAAADNYRTTMPKSAWDRGIARAIKGHCAFSGMSREEAARALGEPTRKGMSREEVAAASESSVSTSEAEALVSSATSMKPADGLKLLQDKLTAVTAHYALLNAAYSASREMGEPARKIVAVDSLWRWQLPPGKCLKYDGEKCVEQEQHEYLVFFTANGSVSLIGDDECYDVNTKRVYSRNDLFGAE
jgi:hypothetical protein